MRIILALFILGFLIFVAMFVFEFVIYIGLAMIAGLIAGVSALVDWVRHD